MLVMVILTRSTSAKSSCSDGNNEGVQYFWNFSKQISYYKSQNHEIPFHFMKKAQAMFSVKHLFSTSLDFCLCRNKISQFHKFHLKHSYIKIFNLINRSVFSARMKMVNTAIAIIASSKSLRWCKNDFHGLNDFMQTKKGDWSSRQPFAHSSFAQFCTVLHCKSLKCNVLRIATFDKGSLKFAQIYWIVLLHYSLLQNSTLNSSLLHCLVLKIRAISCV